MEDYKKMYLKLFQASEQVISILIKAQQECEEIYMQDTSPQIQEAIKDK